MPTLKVGDKVTVYDSAAKKNREGVVTATFSNTGKKVKVYVYRYRNTIEFVDGQSGRGRFILKEWEN